MTLFLVYLIYGLIGLVAGGVSSLLFFRMDTTWKQILVTMFGTGGSLGIYGALTKVCEISDRGTKIGLFAVMLISFIFGLVIIFGTLCKLLKNQDGHNIIRILDVVLGRVNFIQDYYELRKKEIDNKLNIDDIAKKNLELNESMKKLHDKQTKLDEIQTKVDEQLINQVCIDIPINNRIPVTNEFIRLIPEYVDDIAKFINDITNYTNEFCNQYPTDCLEEEAKKRLKSYFLGLCTYVLTDLFYTGSGKRVRAHIRTLDDEEYVSLVATYSLQLYPKKLTPIPKKVGMITKSYEVKRSLIKSLNSEYDFQTDNSSVWEDYMTFTFNNILVNDEPFLTMGISVRNREHYKNIMYFLNFVRFEDILQENIDKLNQVCNIISILSI